MELQNVVLVDGVRTPFSRGGRGMLVATRLDETAALVLRTLMERNPKVSPWMVEDIGLGNVLGVAELILIGANTAARLAGFPLEVCAFDTNRQCGSSMETLHRVAQSIMVGATECGIGIGAGGKAARMAGGLGAGDLQREITQRVGGEQGLVDRGFAGRIRQRGLVRAEQRRCAEAVDVRKAVGEILDPFAEGGNGLGGGLHHCAHGNSFHNMKMFHVM